MTSVFLQYKVRPSLAHNCSKLLFFARIFSRSRSQISATPWPI